MGKRMTQKLLSMILIIFKNYANLQHGIVTTMISCNSTCLKKHDLLKGAIVK